MSNGFSDIYLEPFTCLDELFNTLTIIFPGSGIIHLGGGVKWWYDNNIMKSLLIFPAQWYPTQPYLSTPYLCAYLREKGWNVLQRDFNIESYDSFLSAPLLEKAVTKMEDRLATLRNKKSFSI